MMRRFAYWQDQLIDAPSKHHPGIHVIHCLPELGHNKLSRRLVPAERIQTIVVLPLGGGFAICKGPCLTV